MRLVYHGEPRDQLLLLATRVANNLSARGVCAMIGGVPRLSTPMPELPEAWELGESLGIGSFGSVWRVSHRETAEQGAVKVLPRPEENTHKLMRITTEIATMERSCRGCPFILQLREVHTMERHILIVMELAAGGELLDYLARTDRNEALVRSFFQQLVLGVKFCHSQGVAHRDLKPANLLVGGASGTVLKIADFGLAAEFEPSPSLRCSRQSLRYTLCGSPLYMAPELLNLAEGEGYNPMAADVWSIGTVLFAMLTGRPPFRASSLAELIRMASASKRYLKMPLRLSKECRALLRSLLAVSPQRRATLDGVCRHPWFAPNLDETLALAPAIGHLLPLANSTSSSGWRSFRRSSGASPLARRSSSALSSAAAGPPSPDGSPDVSPEGRRGGGPPDGPSDGDHGAVGLGLADGLAATLGALRRLWSTRGRSSPPKVHPEAGGRASAKSSLLVSGDSPYADEAARLARRFSDDAPGLAQFGSSLTLVREDVRT